jgi:uncharacterized cupin superfamily protein
MGHTFSSLDELGDGPGFRKIRGPLGVTAFGVNAIVLPPGYESNRHYHERQEELYTEATYVCVGGEGGYVGRDGKLAES